MPHEVPSHVALPFAGIWQAWQRVPHVAVLKSFEQVPWQSWKPVLQAYPHVPLLHDAVALPRDGQSVAEQQLDDGMHWLLHCL